MTPEEHARELERIEREIRQRESGSKSDNQVQFYQTTKIPHNQSRGELWKPKIILGLKLFGVGVIALALVKVAGVVANLLIVGTLLFVGYKLFFEKKK